MTNHHVHAGIGAQRFDQVIDLAGGHPVQVGLRNQGEQRLVHPTATFQQTARPALTT